MHMRNDKEKRAFEKSLQSILQEETGGEWKSLGRLDMRREIETMDGGERRALRRALRRVARENHRNMTELHLALSSPIGDGAKAITNTIVRGAAAGVSVAGVVNTLAPGLFSTSMGYMAASLKGTTVGGWLAKLGLVSFGVFAQPTVSQGVILILGAGIGIIVYAIFAILRSMGRAIRRSRE